MAGRHFSCAAGCVAAAILAFGCSSSHEATPPPGGDGGSGGSSGGSGGSSGGGTGGMIASDGGETIGPSGFKHPGVLVTRAQLDFVKSQIAAKAEPWTSAFNAAKASPLASLTYKPTPFASVDCGPSSSNPSNGCKEEQADSEAAYTHALLWYFTGDPAHAEKAVEILDAWGAMLKTHTASNAPPQSGWTGSVFPRAAEIIRYTYTGWAQDKIAEFESMLKAAFLPITLKGARFPFGSKGLVPNGNWEAVDIEASFGIAVFTDDMATWNAAVAMWNQRLPAYMYMTSDGPLPVAPPLEAGATPYTAAQIQQYWGGQTVFMVDGMGQEMCRDSHHLEYGYAAMIDAAETAHIQGVDLYGPNKDRIVAAYEFATGFLDGTPVPPWLCGGVLNLAGATHNWEIGYNEFANRLGIPMPNTLKFISGIRPTDANHHMVWETLTHAEVGKHGL